MTSSRNKEQSLDEINERNGRDAMTATGAPPAKSPKRAKKRLSPALLGRTTRTPNSMPATNTIIACRAAAVFHFFDQVGAVLFGFDPASRQAVGSGFVSQVGATIAGEFL